MTVHASYGFKGTFGEGLTVAVEGTTLATVLMAAIRHSFDRQSYMPSVVLGALEDYAPQLKSPDITRLLNCIEMEISERGYTIPVGVLADWEDATQMLAVLLNQREESYESDADV